VPEPASSIKMVGFCSCAQRTERQVKVCVAIAAGRGLTRIRHDAAHFLHLCRGDARRRSDRLIGARPLTMQRVWIDLPWSAGSSGHNARPLTEQTA
jgi:hypothetical protein